MSKPSDRQEWHAPGHCTNQGPRKRAGRSAKPDREERHQLTRELAPTDQERQSEGVPPGGFSIGTGTSRRQRRRPRGAHSLEGSSDLGRRRPAGGQRRGILPRAAQDLERDAEFHRASVAGEGRPALSDRDAVPFRPRRALEPALRPLLAFDVTFHLAD
jgi:hypothetical protein